MQASSVSRPPREQAETLAELQRQTRTALLEALRADHEPTSTLRRILAAAAALQDEEQSILRRSATSGPLGEG